MSGGVVMSESEPHVRIIKIMDGTTYNATMEQCNHGTMQPWNNATTQQLTSYHFYGCSLLTSSDIFLKISSTPTFSFALVSNIKALFFVAKVSALLLETTLSASKSDLLQAIASMKSSSDT